jgi:hypothetical protein
MGRRWTCVIVALVAMGSVASSCVSAEGPVGTTAPLVSAETAAATPSGTSTPTGSPRVETPSVMLDLAVGPGYGQPGATTPRVGGTTARGPTSVASDDQGRIYLWDHARVRILVYEGGRLARVLAEPFVEEGAASLLVYAGRLYLRWAPNPTPFAEYEIDAATGDLLRVGTDLYPRERAPRSMFDTTGPQRPMSPDTLGNAYQRMSLPDGYEVRRVDRSGAVTAVAHSATTDLVLDSYVAADGSIFDLRQSFDGVLADRIRVVRMLGPAGGVAPERAALIADGPRFAGRDAPAAIEVQSTPELPPARLSPAEARSLWWLLSFSRTDPFYDTLPPPGDTAYRLVATWPDGSTLSIAFDQSLLVAGNARFGTSAMAERAMPQLLSRPAFVVDALRRFGGRVRIPDLPNAGRALTSTEIEAFASALGSAFPTTQLEPYKPLEDPFPRRQLTVAYPGGATVWQDAGDRYLWTGAILRGAIVHDGRASGLLREWLPTPRLAADDPAILYTATKVTLPSQDISRWKASIVRALVLPPATGPGQGTWAAMGPLVFTFTLPGGRIEVVRADDAGFTFAGRTYARIGLLDLHGYEGVP